MQMLANPTDQAWTDLPPMPSAVSNFVGGVIGTKLYVAGGLRWEQGWRIASDELQVYDFETRTWSLGPDLPGPRYYGAGCVCDGRLYLVGGKDESRSLTRSVIVFSPEGKDNREAGWSQVSSLPEFRYYHSCCTYKGKVVVFGGEGDGEVFPPLVLSSISGRQYCPPEEQLWLSEALKNEILDVLGRALASGDEGFSVPLSSLNDELTAPTLTSGLRFGFYSLQSDDTLNLGDRELASKLHRRLVDDDAVLSIPPLPAGYDHPLLAAIVCSAPVG